MKPTSLIFLVLSIILCFGGLMLCNIAKSSAKSQDIKIYEQEINDEGDSVYTYNISDENITKLSLVFSDVDINIIGTPQKSYIELKNFPVNSYKTTLSGSTIKVDGTVSFLSSLIDMSAGGIQFKGLRYFFFKTPEKPRSVNIYISKDSILKTISVSSQKGKVFCKNIPNTIDYSVSVNEADINFDKIKTTSVAELKTKKGNISITTSEFATLTSNIENGNLTIISNGAYPANLTNYNLIATDGKVSYNGIIPEGTPGELKITSPAPKCHIKATVTNGNITVNDT